MPARIPNTALRRSRAIALRAQGLTLTQIGVRLGVSAATVAKWLRSEGC